MLNYISWCLMGNWTVLNGGFMNKCAFRVNILTINNARWCWLTLPFHSSPHLSFPFQYVRYKGRNADTYLQVTREVTMPSSSYPNYIWGLCPSISLTSLTGVKFPHPTPTPYALAIFFPSALFNWCFGMCQEAETDFHPAWIRDRGSQSIDYCWWWEGGVSGFVDTLGVCPLCILVSRAVSLRFKRPVRCENPCPYTFQHVESLNRVQTVALRKISFFPDFQKILKTVFYV